MKQFLVPPTIPDLVRWLGIRQGQGASYYRGLSKRQLLAIFYKEIEKHKSGTNRADGKV